MKTQQERANELIARGNDLRARGKLELACDAYREAIRLVPAYGSLAIVLGDMLFELQRYPAAADAYRTALEFMPGHDQAWTSLGKCLLLQDNRPAALDAFTRAIAANPNHGDAHYYGAMLLVLDGNRKQAAAWLQTALAHKPGWQPHARQDPLLNDLFNEFRTLAKRSEGKKWWRRGKKPKPQV
jgi:tetratricopeptide (TPR) repeat protein